MKLLYCSATDPESLYAQAESPIVGRIIPELTYDVAVYLSGQDLANFKRSCKKLHDHITRHPHFKAKDTEQLREFIMQHSLADFPVLVYQLYQRPGKITRNQLEELNKVTFGLPENLEIESNQIKNTPELIKQFMGFILTKNVCWKMLTQYTERNLKELKVLYDYYNQLFYDEALKVNSDQVPYEYLHLYGRILGFISKEMNSDLTDSLERQYFYGGPIIPYDDEIKLYKEAQGSFLLHSN